MSHDDDGNELFFRLKDDKLKDTLTPKFRSHGGFDSMPFAKATKPIVPITLPQKPAAQITPKTNHTNFK